MSFLCANLFKFCWPKHIIVFTGVYLVIHNIHQLQPTTVLKLFWLVTLGLVVVYIYSVAAFVFFANKFHDPDSSDAQYCGSLVQCYVTIFHYILIGGVSLIINSSKYVAMYLPPVRYICDCPCKNQPSSHKN